jgi:holin-like protein
MCADIMRGDAMILAVAILLSCQLIGETLARGLMLPVPGPVLGMALLLAGCLLLPGLAARVMPTAQGLLSHLSLLFVPAGVGVISHLDVLGGSGPALLLVLVASTALALIAGVLTFVAVARLTGDHGAQAPEEPRP